MDNDQDDDPEEKKKKLDAKDAGSNFGFALGGALGLAATLIAKGKKQTKNAHKPRFFRLKPSQQYIQCIHRKCCHA